MACQMLLEQHGGKVPDTMEALLKLPGVGRKTANLLLGDLYGKPGSIVCDTHCIRICGRLGTYFAEIQLFPILISDRSISVGYRKCEKGV